MKPFMLIYGTACPCFDPTRLARQSLTFYQDDWHVVKRKHVAYARSNADHPMEPTVVDGGTGKKHVYEVDVAVAGSGGSGADTGAVDGMPTEPKIFNVAGVQPRIAPTANGSGANSKGTVCACVSLSVCVSVSTIACCLVHYVSVCTHTHTHTIQACNIL